MKYIQISILKTYTKRNQVPALKVWLMHKYIKINIPIPKQNVAAS